jgi:hypothetical protein
MKASKWKCEVCGIEFESEQGAADCEVSHTSTCRCLIASQIRIFQCAMGLTGTFRVIVNYREKVMEFDTLGKHLLLNKERIDISHCPFCGREL